MRTIRLPRWLGQRIRARRRTCRRTCRLFDVLEPRLLMSVTPHDHHPCDEVTVDRLGNPYHALTWLPRPGLQGATAGGSVPLSGAALDLTQTFLLHSRPGALHTIYLDFDGHVTSGTAWNSSFTGGATIVTPAYDTDGNRGAFSNLELETIQRIWQRVAEDFSPLEVNVTTQDPGAARLSKSGGGDTQWGIRVAIGGSSTDWFQSGAGGVAYLDSFNWSTDTPTFVFEDQLGDGHEKYTAEAISHEVGHTLGLQHDGNATTEYYSGHGTGATGWAPIMGVGYYKELTQWSKGEYGGANNREDDLAVITSRNGFGYRSDDHGDTSAGASPLQVLGTGVSGAGILERATDVDVFSFVTDGGTISLTVSPFERGPNLDLMATLYDTSQTLIAMANPADLLAATLTHTVAAGQYYLQVSGVGKGDALSGYSDYGSLGQYFVTGSIVTANQAYLSLQATDAQKAEGQTGTTAFTFSVTRSGDLSSAATVHWAVTGSGTTAASATDFVDGMLPSGVIAFAAGEPSQTITVNVQGDATAEANETFTVSLTSPSGGLILAGTASGTILNDDVVSGVIKVSPTSGLTTKESRTSASFSVVLMSAPKANVVISVQSLDTTEGTVNRSTLTFTPTNWSTRQVVTVRGVDDTLLDGNVSYTVRLGPAVSADPAYHGVDPADVQVTNQDNERAKRSSSRSTATHTAVFGAENERSWALFTADYHSSWGNAIHHTDGTSNVRRLVESRATSAGLSALPAASWTRRVDALMESPDWQSVARHEDSLPELEIMAEAPAAIFPG